ncbi:DUF3165 family protein [Streptococcus sp. X16XC17]|uniref:DUF3165 family protein n=1 Tax=unclassified Streptococcus TaxID=2608887 RepID=UPI00066FDBEE|nr:MULTISPECIES: DUF3165 family protein [unclassified Streptococcus]TCD45986.1 DUF3165 family protein [Streptococcus sp. X16XC17]
MFYLILAIMLVLFYIFAAPSHIKGTMNLVASVFLLVGLFVFLLLGFLQIIKSPPELWLSIGMVFVGIWAMHDIHYMGRSHKRHNKIK